MPGGQKDLRENGIDENKIHHRLERLNMFTVIGERINMTRKSIREKVWERDEVFVRNEAALQAKAGATHIDVNAGGNPEKEIEDMKWLASVVMKEVELPLVYDSANFEAIKAGLEICNRPGTIINSMTMEKERIKSILPLVKQYNTSIICLTMNDEGMPEDLDGRIKIAEDITGLLSPENISLERAYFDFLVRPASTHPGQAGYILDAIRWLKKTHPQAHASVGLSNVSYGLPKRNNINKAFLAMIVEAGADAAIIDPTETDMMTILYSSRAVLGIDEYGIEYLERMRGEGLA
jgi:5-methyltetrahydrofolate--homocysteine methyltransferase